MEIMSLLKELRDLVDNSTKMPFTGKVMLDHEEVVEIVEDLHRAIPDEIRKGEEIKKERELILAEAHEKAEKILSEAKKYVNKMAQENEIVAKAQDEAHEINKQAKAVAEEITGGAKNYADEILAGLEKNITDMGQSLEHTLGILKDAREQLK